MLDPEGPVTEGRRELAAPTLVRLTVAPPRARDAEPVTLQASVITMEGLGRLPTGSVAFRSGHRVLGAAPLDTSGRAVLTGVRLPSGLHPVVASYGGDAWHAAASSAAAPHAAGAAVVVDLAVPERTLEGVVLRAQILDAATGRIREGAVGQVDFSLDDALLGGAPVSGGASTLVLSELPVGRISARFSGDLEHAAAEADVGRARTPAPRKGGP